MTRWPLILVLAGAALVFTGIAACSNDGDRETEPPGQTESGHAATPDGADDTYWTCPMHPEVVQDGPGACPICKMDLVKKEKPGASKATPSPAETGGAKADDGERKIKYWVAPMDPTYVRDEPGKSPMGMDLVPVYEDEAGPAATTPAGPAVTIDPVVEQNMGVRLAHVERGDLTRSVRAVGEVEVAEEALSVVNLRYSGWIEKIHVDETGVRVRRGGPLFSVYSPALVQAQEEYLQAIRAGGTGGVIAKSAKTRLDRMVGGSWLSNAVRKSGRTHTTITVPAPDDGYVLHKNVVLGSKVMAGSDLYRIGTLDPIWVTVEVYEIDAPWIETGQQARMELPFQQGRTFEGEVDYIYPTLDPRTRTLKVRLILDNSDLSLKPGMFATVWIDAQTKTNVLTIPTEAIIHSGEREIVFVNTDGGRYEPREVRTGLIGDGFETEVLSGLKPGDAVVTSGQFLLDSESQLQEAVQKLLDARLKSKRPQEPETGAAERPQAYEHDEAETYWTCPMHPQIVQDGPGQCPICKMDLVEKKR